MHDATPSRKGRGNYTPTCAYHDAYREKPGHDGVKPEQANAVVQKHSLPSYRDPLPQREEGLFSSRTVTLTRMWLVPAMTEGKSGDGKVIGLGRWSHVVDGRRTASDSAA
jgi:hypothetical protein